MAHGRNFSQSAVRMFRPEGKHREDMQIGAEVRKSTKENSFFLGRVEDMRRIIPKTMSSHLKGHT